MGLKQRALGVNIFTAACFIINKLIETEKYLDRLMKLKIVIFLKVSILLLHVTMFGRFGKEACFKLMNKIVVVDNILIGVGLNDCVSRDFGG